MFGITNTHFESSFVYIWEYPISSKKQQEKKSTIVGATTLC